MRATTSLCYCHVKQRRCFLRRESVIAAGAGWLREHRSRVGAYDRSREIFPWQLRTAGAGWQQQYTRFHPTAAE
jgi:hypothetical protein